MSNLTHKKEYKQKNGDKDRKALYKLMNNAVHHKTMENLKNAMLELQATKKTI